VTLGRTLELLDTTQHRHYRHTRPVRYDQPQPTSSHSTCWIRPGIVTIVILHLLDTTQHRHYRLTQPAQGRLGSSNMASCCCWRRFAVHGGCCSFMGNVNAIGNVRILGRSRIRGLYVRFCERDEAGLITSPHPFSMFRGLPGWWQCLCFCRCHHPLCR